jgi:hypothetical protein
MSISLIITGALFLVDLVGSVVLAVHNMPDGYEDEFGFHYQIGTDSFLNLPLDASVAIRSEN